MSRFCPPSGSCFVIRTKRNPNGQSTDRALAKAEASGPIFKSLEIDGDKAVLHFTHTDGGLVAKGGPLTGFVIAGADHHFVFADARIEGDTVIVSSAQVPHPVAVRYARADFPKANLFSRSDLPASPFRTDAET
ncbi:MAG TPA: hypothetical protein VLJ39_00210, partial [Tepidisphaeraceae bacterium]|nr:hypothetical protein [Tepidisphaeraceae bacterium]